MAERQCAKESSRQQLDASGESNASAVTVVLTVLVLLIIFSTASTVVTPPDIISQLTAMAVMIVVFGLILWPISRFRYFKKTPATMKAVIAVLVCLLTVSLLSSLVWFRSYRGLRAELAGRPEHMQPEETSGAVDH